MKKLFLLVLISLQMFVISCNDDNANDDNNDKNTTKELLKTELIQLKVGLEGGIESSARLVYDDKNEDNIKLFWSENDKIRVYWKDNDNYFHSSVFTLKDGVGTSEGTFEGMAPESLPENASYEILYPAEKFSENYLGQESFYDQISLPIDNQKQMGNDNIEHLQGYNYMKSSEKNLDDFFFRQNMMSLLKLELTFPESYNPALHSTPSTLSIVADRDIFVPVCGNSKKSNKIDLALENIELDSNNKLIAYVMGYPAILPIDGKITITVLTEKGTIYSAIYQNLSNREMVYAPGTYNTIQTNLEPKANVSGQTINLAAPGLLANNPELISEVIGVNNYNPKLTIVGSVNNNDLYAIKYYLQEHDVYNLEINLTDTDLINIPDECFKNCSLFSFTALNVKNIGNYAFAECGLSSINLPSVTNIGNYAFSGRKDNVIGLNNLSSVNLPAVKNIGDYAFEYCMDLSSINCPIVETIGKGAFYNCDKLSTINFPSVQSIGEKAFESAEVLSVIEFPKLTTIDKDAFAWCTNLESMNLPSVIFIDNGAFLGCTNLKSVSLPNVLSIGTIKNSSLSSDGVFYGCSNLKNVDMPLINNIGDCSFWDCINLSTVNIPQAVNIGASAFCSCSSLLSINLPFVSSIGNNSFYKCSILFSISIPKLVNIGYNAISVCHSLSSVNLPSVINVNDGNFCDCPNLSSLILSSPNLTSMTVNRLINSTNINLTLHINKKNEVSGFTWNDLNWKSINFVDDNGNPVIE